MEHELYPRVINKIFSLRLGYLLVVLIAIASVYLIHPRLIFSGSSFPGDLDNNHHVGYSDFQYFISHITNGLTIFDYNSIVQNYGLTDPTHVNVGATYWHCCISSKRNEVEMLLSYNTWQDRQPYFTIPRGGESVDIHEANQAVVDQEIQLAADAGLDYWSIFGLPSNSDGFNYGLDYYLKSPNKNKLKFTLMLWESLTDADSAKVMQLIKDPQYLRVTAQNRPLIFVWLPDSLDFKDHANEFKKLIQTSVSQTGQTPLLVAMPYTAGPQELKNWGFTDLSWYATGSVNKGEPYSDLTNRAFKNWEDAKSNGYLGVIPNATTGFDPRPKWVNPLYHAYGTDSPWTIEGDPAAIANHIQSAINWVNNNPQVAKSKTVLIYAWNELAEGGWLMPTISHNNQNQRLNAISQVLGGKVVGVPVSPYANNPPTPHPKGTIQITNPKSGDTFPANQQLSIIGSGPFAARITAKIGTNQTFFINGKYATGETSNFIIPVGGLPKGTYSLNVTSPDASGVTIQNISIGNPVVRGLISVNTVGNSATVSFVNNENYKDWIGLYKIGSNNAQYLDWKWLNNQQGQPPIIQPNSGSVKFNNIPPGNYDVRYIYEGNGGAGVFSPGLLFSISPG